MRPIISISIGLAALLGASLQACSSSSGNGGFPNNTSSSSGSSSGSSGGGSSGSSSGSSGGSSGGSSSGLVGDGGSIVDEGGDGSITIKTTIYANTDDTLYSMDPTTNQTTAIGPFAGTSDSSTDSAVTDCAVDAAGEVYVNTESVVYKATLPATPPGTVTLTKVATIQVTGGAKFFALAFAPAGALDPTNETLIGGDGAGTLWSIDTSTGTTKNLGNFGADKSIAGNSFVLSGDLVFYLDPTTNKPTGLATIRSCPPGGSGSKCSKDYLAGVEMTNLLTAFTSGTPATTLLGGIYGGSAAGPGPGTGFGDVFGLGAWNSKVFGFTRHIGSTPAVAPQLITIDTASGVGTTTPNTYAFTNGWSGAGVTTKVTISVPKPPPPPAQ